MIHDASKWWQKRVKQRLLVAEKLGQTSSHLGWIWMGRKIGSERNACAFVERTNNGKVKMWINAGTGGRRDPASLLLSWPSVQLLGTAQRRWERENSKVEVWSRNDFLLFSDFQLTVGSNHHLSVFGPRFCAADDEGLIRVSLSLTTWFVKLYLSRCWRSSMWDWAFVPPRFVGSRRNLPGFSGLSGGTRFADYVAFKFTRFL